MSAASPDRRQSIAPLEVATADVRTEITLGGTFICQDTVVAVVSLNNATVCTAELGGWIRKREVSTGQVFQQCRLRSSQDPTTICLCGDRLWVGQSEGLITVLSASELQPLADCSLHQQGITSIVRFGDVIVSSCADGCFACWDATTFKCTSCIPVRRNGALNFCLPLTHGLLVNTDSNEVALLDWDKFELVQSFIGHEQDVLSAAVCDGVLWTGGHDHSLRLFDVAGGHLLRSLHAHTAPVHAIYRSPAGDRTWSASMDGRVILWDASSIEPLGELPLSYPKGPTRHFVFCIAPVASTLVWKVWTCATDGVVKCWLSQSDEQSKTLHLQERVQTLEAEITSLVQRAPFTEEQLTTFMREKGREFDLEKDLLFSEICQLLIIRDDAVGRFRLVMEESSSFASILAERSEMQNRESERLSLHEQSHNAQLRQMGNDLSAQLVTIRNLEQSADAAQHKIILAETERNKLVQELSKFEHKLSVTEDRVLLKSAAAERYLAEIDELRMESEAHNRHVRESDDERRKLMADLEKMRILCNEESQRVAAKERRIVALEGDLAEMKNAVSTLRRELRQKNEDLGNRAASDELETQHKQMSELLSECRKEAEGKREQILQLQAEIQSREKEHRLELEALRQELVAVTAHKNSLQSEASSFAQARRDSAVEKEARQALESRLASMEKELNMKERKMEELLDAKQVHEAKSSAMAVELQHLKLELDRRKLADEDAGARLRAQFDEVLQQQNGKIAKLFEEIANRDDNILSLKNALQLSEAQLRAESASFGEERLQREKAEKQLKASQLSCEQLQREADNRSLQLDGALTLLKNENSDLAHKLEELSEELKRSKEQLVLVQTSEASLVEHVKRMQGLETAVSTAAAEAHEWKEKHQTVVIENSHLRADLDAAVGLFEAREHEHSRAQLASTESMRTMTNRIAELESLMRTERLRMATLENDLSTAKSSHEAQLHSSQAEYSLRNAEIKISELEAACRRAENDSAASREALRSLEVEILQLRKSTVVYEQARAALENTFETERQALVEQRTQAEVAQRSQQQRIDGLLEEVGRLEMKLREATEHAEALKTSSTHSVEREERILTVTAERDGLSREIGEVRRSLQKSEDTSKNLIAELERSHADAIRKLEDRMTQERDLSGQLLEECNGELQLLRGQLEDAKTANASAEARIDELEAALEQHLAQLRDKERECSEVKNLLDEAYRSLVGANTETSRLQEENAVLSALCTELQDDLAETKHLLSSASQAHAADREELAAQYEKIEKYQLEVKRLVGENTRLEEQARQLTAQLFEERETELLQKEQALATAASLKREVESLLLDRTHLSQEVTLLTARLADAEKKVLEAMATFEQQDQALIHSTANLRLLQEEAEHLRHKLAVAGDEVRTLKSMNSYKDEIIAQVATDANRTEYRVFST